MSEEHHRPAPPYPIRPLTEDDWPRLVALDQEAFNMTYSPEAVEVFRRIHEFDRGLAAFDGDLLVGSVSAYSLTMTVPGGPIPVAGVTWVSVLGSHRRRGVLRSLMLRQLDDLHERGDAVAALYASEAAIYGRFGYGRAADALSFRIPTHRSAFRPDAPADPRLRLRIARPAEVQPELEKVYNEIVTTRPGLYARSAGLWGKVLRDGEEARGGMGPLRCVLVEDDGGPRGYALFRVKPGFTEWDVPDGEVHLRELFAVDPAAYAAVWRAVLDRDLCARVVAASRPVDDPIAHLLVEPRVLTSGVHDDLWVRLVDVGKALTARRYAAPVDVVIEVRDPVCPWNEGRWRLAADASGATCERTTAPADVELPVDALGAGYLGGRPLTGYGAAGWAREHRPGALAALSVAMSWEPRPWGGFIF